MAIQGSLLDASGNANLSRGAHSVGLRGGDRARRGIGAARIISEEPSLSQPSGGFFALAALGLFYSLFDFESIRSIRSTT